LFLHLMLALVEHNSDRSKIVQSGH